MSYSKQEGRREEKLRSCVLLGEMIKFQKLLRVQQAKDRKLTLEIDQMQLIRDLDKKNINGVLRIEYKLG